MIGSDLVACLRAEGFISRVAEPGDADYDKDSRRRSIPCVALTEPPERLAEAVERLGVARVALERRRERVAGGRPVGVGEVLPRGVQHAAEV